MGWWPKQRRKAATLAKDVAENLVGHDAVHPDHGIVLGDDFLRGSVNNLFHHVDPGTNLVDDSKDHVQAWRQGRGILAESLHGIFRALRDELDAQGDEKHREQQQEEYEKHEAGHG